MASLTLLDIIVLLFLGVGGLLGAMRGFVYEVLSLFAWAAVVVALKLFYAPLTGVLGTHIHTHAGAGLLAFVLLSVVVFILGRNLADRIGRRTRTSILGPVDRALGLGFGAVKGLIGVTLLYMAGNLVFNLAFTADAPRPDWVRTARSYPLLQASRHAIDDFVAHRQTGPEGGPSDNAATTNSTDARDHPI